MEHRPLDTFVKQAPKVPQPYLTEALKKVLSEKDIKSLAKTIGKQLDARSMVAKPIEEASLLPPYGTILRNKAGEHAMYLGRSNSKDKIAVPGNAMVILDDETPYVYQCTDMQMLRQWQIVSEAQK